MRDGLSLVNVTRRELADGLRALARRQRDARMTSADLEANFARRLNDNTYKIDLKVRQRSYRRPSTLYDLPYTWILCRGQVKDLFRIWM